MEAKLQVYPQARAEAEALQRAWDLLDYLPSAEPSSRFTQQTLSRLQTISKSTGRRLPRRRLVAGAAWAAGVLLVFAAGWAGYDHLVPWQPGERELVRDLRLIENKRLYDAVDDLNFLKQLDQPELFGEEHAGS
jgi:hypothetical protein